MEYDFCFYLFKKLVYFNWRIITLQYCDGFWHTLTWNSHGCTCVPPSWTYLPLLSPHHPSELFQSTSFECPASCIKLAPVIYFIYGDIHVSMLFSQIIPPSPSLTESKSLCLFCCLAYRVIITIFLSEWVKSLSCVWLFATPWTVAYQAPLSMGFSRQEYWRGLPFPSPGDLLKPGIEPTSPVSPALAGGFFTTELPGKPT